MWVVTVNAFYCVYIVNTVICPQFLVNIVKMSIMWSRCYVSLCSRHDHEYEVHKYLLELQLHGVQNKLLSCWYVHMSTRACTEIIINKVPCESFFKECQITMIVVITPVVFEKKNKVLRIRMKINRIIWDNVSLSMLASELKQFISCR